MPIVRQLAQTFFLPIVDTMILRRSDIAGHAFSISLPMPADDRDALIDWLRDRDVACPSCSYNLRGLVEPRCPECGQEVSLSVTLVDVYAAAWVVMAVAVCGSAGLGLIFGGIFLRQGRLPHEGKLLDGSILLYICTIPMPLPLLRMRRRFQRLPRPVQWSIAGPVVAVATGALAVLCAGLR